MIRRWLSRFMVGRYGMDQLNLFLVVTYLVLYVLNLFLRLTVISLISLVILVLYLFRALSRRLDRRRAENSKFLQVTRPILRKLKSAQVRVQDREHRYFRCPNCGQEMRVPRGKGRITVHCRSCGASFEEKS